jgi:hypothetical protein
MSKKRENKTSKLVDEVVMVGAEEVARRVVENKPDKHIYDDFSDYLKWTCCVDDIARVLPVLAHVDQARGATEDNDVLRAEESAAVLRGLWQTADGAVAHIISLAKNGGLGQGSDGPTPEALDSSKQ